MSWGFLRTIFAVTLCALAVASPADAQQVRRFQVQVPNNPAAVDKFLDARAKPDKLIATFESDFTLYIYN